MAGRTRCVNDAGIEKNILSLRLDNASHPPRLDLAFCDKKIIIVNWVDVALRMRHGRQLFSSCARKNKAVLL